MASSCRVVTVGFLSGFFLLLKHVCAQYINMVQGFVDKNPGGHPSGASDAEWCLTAALISDCG